MIAQACKFCGWNIFAKHECVAVCGRCGKRTNVRLDGQKNLAPGSIIRRCSIKDPWSAIHRYPIENDWNELSAREWYYHSWLPSIPVFRPDGASCGCQTHWAGLTDEFPPDFSSAAAFERWAHDRHDDVSRLHSGATRISFEQSLRMWRGPRVGFLAASYVEIGGTETFHQTLLPLLRHRVQLVGFWASLFIGDMSLLRVPCYPSADALIDDCDTLVVWGLEDLTGILNGRQRRVISVHHSDITSDWSNRLQEQAPIAEVVCVNPEVASVLASRLSIPVRYIPNPMPPAIRSSVGLRSQYKLGDRKIILWPHRDSPEKQPDLARQVAAQLPDDYVMVMTTSGAPSPRVVYVGKQPQAAIADWLAISHCLLSLAKFEGFGYSAAEAMLQRVPVVSYAQGICNESNATIIPPESPPKQIASLCASSQQPPADGLAFLELHTAETVTNQWTELLFI